MSDLNFAPYSNIPVSYSGIIFQSRFALPPRSRGVWVDSLTRCTQPVPPYHTAPAHFSSCPARSLRQNTALASLQHWGLLHTYLPPGYASRGAKTLPLRVALGVEELKLLTLKCEYVSFNLAAPPLLLSSIDTAAHTSFYSSPRLQEPLHYQSGGSSSLLSPLSLIQLVRDSAESVSRTPCLKP